jgi:hypothetical protein
MDRRRQRHRGESQSELKIRVAAAEGNEERSLIDLFKMRVRARYEFRAEAARGRPAARIGLAAALKFCRIVAEGVDVSLFSVRPGCYLLHGPRAETYLRLLMVIGGPTDLDAGVTF